MVLPSCIGQLFSFIWCPMNIIRREGFDPPMKKIRSALIIAVIV